MNEWLCKQLDDVFDLECKLNWWFPRLTPRECHAIIYLTLWLGAVRGALLVERLLS